MAIRLLLLAAIAGVVASPAAAEMVTARWGAGSSVQHDGTVKLAAKEGALGTLIFDLSALPRDAKVYSARLFMPAIAWNDPSYELIPAGGDKPLKLVAPCLQWWDASEAAAAWAKKGSGRLDVRKGKRFDAAGVVLEIAYEAAPPRKLPDQVSEVRALYRGGQVFVTFKETQPVDGGKERIAWPDIADKFRGDYYGPVAGQAAGPDASRTGVTAPATRGVRYRVYRHDEPITPKTIGQARLVAELLPGTALNTRMSLLEDADGKRPPTMTAAHAGRSGEGIRTGPTVIILRSAVEDGKPVPPSTGICVDTVQEAGKVYYAVLAAENGVVNAADITAANTAGPVEVAPAEPQPVMYKELTFDVRGAKYSQQWYSYWTSYPLSAFPARYDVVVGYCPEILAKPASLYIARSGWNVWPAPSGPSKTDGLMLSHCSDQPVDMLTGLLDSHGTQKGTDLGRYVPFFPLRQDALVRWAKTRWAVDPNRISAHLGDWGMQEIKRGDTYFLIRGWGQPEMTKGFQSWGRAHGIWGPPELYKDRPDAENPYLVSNVTDWMLANPAKELPFVIHYARGGSHFSEMGWPPTPRFLWAMMKTKRAFVYGGRGSPAESAINSGQIRLAMNLSVPAFANCSLDDNPGDGDIRSGDNFAAVVNGYMMWDSETIVDQPKAYEITVWVDGSSFYPDALVDMTPRRCRKFRAAPGAKFAWTNSLIEPPAPAKEKPKGENAADAKAAAPVLKQVQSGSAVADANGLVTLERLAVTKARHRIRIVPQ